MNFLWSKDARLGGDDLSKFTACTGFLSNRKFEVWAECVPEVEHFPTLVAFAQLPPRGGVFVVSVRSTLAENMTMSNNFIQVLGCIAFMVKV